MHCAPRRTYVPVDAKARDKTVGHVTKHEHPNSASCPLSPERKMSQGVSFSLISTDLGARSSLEAKQHVWHVSLLFSKRDAQRLRRSLSWLPPLSFTGRSYNQSKDQPYKRWWDVPRRPSTLHEVPTNRKNHQKQSQEL